MTRAKILGRKLYESLATTNELRDRRRSKLQKRIDTKPNQSEYRAKLIRWAVEQAVFDHLGFGPTVNLQEVLNTGLNQACTYFFEDWWQESEVDRYFLDKTADYPVQAWYYTVQDAVLLAHWTNRWSDGLRILDWVDDDVARGVSHGIPELNFYLYLVSLLHRRLSIHEQLAEAVRKSSSRFEKLLVECCESVTAHDEEKFADTINKAVKQFLRSESEDAPNFMYWISPVASLVWAFAERKKMVLPELDEVGDAVLVRPVSIFSESLALGNETALLEQNDLDAGLVTAVAELDYDAFETLISQGANADREEEWDADLLGIERSGLVLPAMSSRKLVSAIRDRFAGLKETTELTQLASEILQRARCDRTDDDIEAEIDGLCDLMELPRPGDSSGQVQE